MVYVVMGLTLLGDDSEQITRGQDEVFLTVVLDFSSAVLAVQDDVAFLDVERNAAFAVFIPAAGGRLPRRLPRAAFP